MIDDHLAKPGPLYWEWRCLICDAPVAEHVGLLTYLKRKIFR